MRYFTFVVFSQEVSGIQCEFYHTYPFRSATFQVPSGHRVLLATTVGCADSDLSVPPAGLMLSSLCSHTLPSAWSMPSTTSNPLCWANFQIRSLSPGNSPCPL